jgi:hypothetical protein
VSALRFRDGARRGDEVILDARPGGDGVTAPFTLGHGADEPRHVAVAGATARATLVASACSAWYAWVVAGDGVTVNGGPIHGVRVLRHGDRLQLGPAGVTYFDFVLRAVAEGSRLAGTRCASARCPWGRPIDVGDESATCPWCDAAYHASCWLALERCTGQRGECYPVRRMLLAELGDRVKIDKLPEGLNESAGRCGADCETIGPTGIPSINPPIRAGEAVIRCRNGMCRSPYYHPGCWLAMKACRCGFRVDALMGRVLFGDGDAR